MNVLNKILIILIASFSLLQFSSGLILAEEDFGDYDFGEYDYLDDLLDDDKPLIARTIPDIAQGQQWIGQFICTEDKTISPKDAQAAGFIQMPFAGEDKFIKAGAGWCFTLDKVGAIYNYDSSYVVDYCPKGTSVGRKGDAPLSFVKGFYSCCENGYPYLYENGVGTNMICCKQPGLDLKAGAKICTSNDSGVEPKARIRLQSGEEMRGIFSKATPKYTCGIQDCFFQGEKPAEGIKRGTYTKEQIDSLGIQCYPDTSSGDYQHLVVSETFTTPGGSKFYCVAGDALEPDEYEIWKDKLNAYVGCKAFGNNTSEFNNCTSCLRQCIDCVYSSLGCVNPSMNGIISTIMRIALGILGTVAIVRIMQAAILRQSGDPKDIQESWDIIMSVIIGAVVLVSATLLLRVIGINVLGILPYDF